jgi:hypothetical protein
MMTRALGEPGLERLHVPDAAAELHGDRDARQDRVDGGRVAGLPREGAVEIDHVKPGEALILEGRPLRSRVVVEHLGLGHVALHEADAAALLQIDGRVQDHGRTRLCGRGL